MTVYINGVAQAPALKKLGNPICICVENAADGYEWVQIGIST